MSLFKSSLKLERYYIWMVIFIVLFTVISNIGTPGAPKKQQANPQSELQIKLEERLGKDRTFIEKILKEKPKLAYMLSIATISGSFMFIFGLFILTYFLINIIKKTQPIRRFEQFAKIDWGVIDVTKVIILFIFFAYVLLILESAFLTVAGIKEYDKNLRGIINTTLLDLFALSCVIYFVKVKFKQRLSLLGLTIKRFFKSVFVGIAGYLALLPVLFMTLVIVIVIANIFKYKPPTEPIVQMLFEEKRSRLLAYLTFFVAIGGPFVEEIFFRGFFYQALKKVVSVRWAVLISSGVFSALHTNVIGFLPILFLGMILAYLYEKTGTLTASITLHVIHNSVILFLIFMIKELIR